MSMAFQDCYLDKLPFHPLFLLPFLLIIFCLSKYYLTSKPTLHRKNTPPSPPKLPIFGNLHQLSKLPHHSLHSLSKRYGPLMLLHFGIKPTLVVSSAKLAQQIMTTHDIIFSNRPNFCIARRLLNDCLDLTFAPYGGYWRQLRSLSTLQLLCKNKVLSFQTIREEETARMVEKLKRCCGSVVDLSEVIVTQANDVACRAIFGKRSSDLNTTATVDVFKEGGELLGAVSFRDVVPWLSWVDRVSGLESRVEKVAEDLEELVEEIVRERQEHMKLKGYKNDAYDYEGSEGEKVKNFVDALLEIQAGNEGGLSIDTIKILLSSMLGGGTETTSTLLVWAMTELLRHPTSMKELQEEVRQVVKGKARVSVEDLENMNYLKAVIKETLRFHPPAPLLIFRESSQDVNISGYDIAAKTQVVINAWAIQRDPTYWEEPEEFRPERFLNSSVDFKGTHFQLIPFGAGRRGCPGISFSIVIVELVLATLVYQFDWKIPDGFESKSLDISETVGLTSRKRHPLMLIPTPYTW